MTLKLIFEMVLCLIRFKELMRIIYNSQFPLTTISSIFTNRSVTPYIFQKSIEKKNELVRADWRASLWCQIKYKIKETDLRTYDTCRSEGPILNGLYESGKDFKLHCRANEPIWLLQHSIL